MNSFNNKILFALLALLLSVPAFAQTGSTDDNEPKDYLSASFHAGRRQALRNMMPANSVMAVFAYPERNFSNDVNYVYHPNPDLYYFSGYKEPDAMLLVFKDMQTDKEGTYNEVMFVRKRDPQREQWTGRRLGVEGTITKLGFKRVYTGDAFANFPLAFKKFDSVIYDALPETIENEYAPGNINDLVSKFKSKAGIENANKELVEDLVLFQQRTNPENLSRILDYITSKMERPAYKNNKFFKEVYNKPDTTVLNDVKDRILMQYKGIALYSEYTERLRGIKTPEELALLKKSVQISSVAHKEVIRAGRPQMSERELEGIFRYVHNKYGAEDEGYPPIVGTGANACILHYEENNAVQLKNQLVLMDVGAEYHGYSADVTRTFPANGKFSNAQRAIYELVYNAQEEVFKLCKEGITYRLLETRCTEFLAKGLIQLGIIKNANEVKTYYTHTCSHHLGLDVHDKGSYTGKLQANMVITVEPGIYIPAGSPCDKKWWNIGVRIEDDVVIGKDKGTILSVDAPRKWQDVERVVAEKSMFDTATLPVLK